MAERLLILVAVALFGIGLGWKIGADQAEAKKVKAYEDALKAKDVEIEAERVANGAVSAALQAEGLARESDRVNYERKLKNARNAKLVESVCPGADNRSGTPAAPDAAVPGVRFTADFIRLWNDGLAIGSSQAERAGRPDGAGAGTVMVEPVLENHGENAGRWAQCRAQVRGWQSWACERGFAAPNQCGR